jgi:ubiquinone/menaquinone biosynthesis C-methylase UbiE
VCLNISEVQNQKNEQLNKKHQLENLVTVKSGNFEDIPFPDDAFDIVWSQDAFLHSSNRSRILEEVRRVLKKGGDLIFTDPMQSPICPPGTVQAALDRLNINEIASADFYRDTLQNLGFQKVCFIDLSAEVPTHYKRFSQSNDLAISACF